MINLPLNVDYTGKVVVTAAREELIYKQKATDGSLLFTQNLHKSIDKYFMQAYNELKKLAAKCE